MTYRQHCLYSNKYVQYVLYIESFAQIRISKNRKVYVIPEFLAMKCTPVLPFPYGLRDYVRGDTPYLTTVLLSARGAAERRIKGKQSLICKGTSGPRLDDQTELQESLALLSHNCSSVIRAADAKVLLLSALTE